MTIFDTLRIQKRIMIRSNRKDQAVFKTFANLGDLEVLEADYFTHAFGLHSHNRYALSMIHKGAGKFAYRGKERIAAQGDMTILNPNEPHDGCVLGQSGWSYHIIYIKPDYLSNVAADLGIGDHNQLKFSDNPVFSNPGLYQRLMAFHLSLKGSQDDLELEAQFHQILTDLIRQYARPSVKLKPIEHKVIPLERACDYINDNYAHKIKLAQLSNIAGISKFHLLRSFKRHFGMSPQLYLNQIRVNKAKDLLAQGYSIVDVANSTGFYDQSHLTKTLKSALGVTPGSVLKKSNILQYHLAKI